MDMQISFIVSWLSLLFILLNFALYPAVLIVSGWLKKISDSNITASLPTSVSFIVVAHNAEDLIENKINNFFDLKIENIEYEIIVYLDGCTDKTFERASQIKSDKIRIVSEDSHLGKVNGLNYAAQISKFEILIFTDTDALLDKDSVAYLLENFKDPQCGGVCGLRTINRKNKLRAAQDLYIKFDSYLKQLENINGNITSNDGKLYAVRRKIFKPIASDTTDDLYNCLNITEQHYRFLFDDRAKAYVPVPSRDIQHEVLRRRRIVIGSLSGIYQKRAVLNPFKYGTFAIGLFINKVLRRTLGVSLIFLFVSSFYSAPPFFYLQLAFYLTAISYPLFFANAKAEGFIFETISKVTSSGWYFCVGNYATLLGVMDFLSGKRVTKWTPQKQV